MFGENDCFQNLGPAGIYTNTPDKGRGVWHLGHSISPWNRQIPGGRWGGVRGSLRAEEVLTRLEMDWQA